LLQNDIHGVGDAAVSAAAADADFVVGSVVAFHDSLCENNDGIDTTKMVDHNDDDDDDDRFGVVMWYCWLHHYRHCYCHYCRYL
jgi:hypothetical protein